MLSLIVSASLPVALGFSPEPIGEQFALGKKLYLSGVGIERIFREDRQVFGLWFDGRTMRDTDEMIWISPALISRWLGFLSVREKWRPEEAQQRWESIRNKMETRLYFVMRCSAFPKKNLFNDENDRDADPTQLDTMRIQLTIDGHQIAKPPSRDMIRRDVRTLEKFPTHRVDPIWAEVSVDPLGQVQTQSWKSISYLHWLYKTPWKTELMPEFAPMPEVNPIPRGDYYVSWKLLSLPITERISQAKSMQFWIFSPGKEQWVEYSLIRKSSPKV